MQKGNHDISTNKTEARDLLKITIEIRLHAGLLETTAVSPVLRSAIHAQSITLTRMHFISLPSQNLYSVLPEISHFSAVGGLADTNSCNLNSIINSLVFRGERARARKRVSEKELPYKIQK